MTFRPRWAVLLSLYEMTQKFYLLLQDPVSLCRLLQLQHGNKSVDFATAFVYFLYRPHLRYHNQQRRLFIEPVLQWRP